MVRALRAYLVVGAGVRAPVDERAPPMRARPSTADTLDDRERTPGSSPVGHGRHPGRHRAVLDRHRVRHGREVRRHLVAGARPQPRRQRAARLRGLHPRAHGHRPHARGDRRRAPRRRGRSASPRGAVATGRPRAAGGPARRGRPVRAGDDVVDALRRADPRAPARGHVRDRGHRRPGASSASRTPSPTCKAAADLGVDPADCVAIEDSNTGATSAEAAGCLVLCVPHHVPILEGERRVFVDTLAGLDTAALAALVPV